MTGSLPNPDLRGLFLGSGSALAEPGMAELVVELSGRDAPDLRLLYLGTASYDAAEPRARQVARFAALGCRIDALEIARRDLSPAALKAAVEGADIVLVSGGNTLYAVDRWVALGLDDLLRQALREGVVACGGSAGAICWFDGGHSDSMDPTSVLEPLAADDPEAADWRYIRVDGLGLLPGLLCPHYEATQSNGLARAADFRAMLLRHSGELGLGLDEFAGLFVDGDRYRVVRAEGRSGSVRGDRFVADRSGLPGLWLHEVIDGRVSSRLAPNEGRLADILRPARSIDGDPLVASCRAKNPVRLAQGPALCSGDDGCHPQA
jgi:dipeptidase E